MKIRKGFAGRWTAGSLLLALTISSCSEKPKIVDPVTRLEGRMTPDAQLIVYPDVPLRTYVMLDTVLGDGSRKETCSADDSLITVFEERVGSPSTVHAFIFDFTPANTFQVFRREAGAYRSIKDYPLQPTRRYPFGLAEVYSFDDPAPLPAPFQDYVGRGVVDGAITPTSPITNVGSVRTEPTASIRYTGRTNICGDVPALGEAPPDSLLPMSWTPVPGAAGYWVQIFQFGVGANFLASRFPAPAFVARSVDYFLAYFPGTVTSYKIGDPLPAGARVLTQRTLLNNTDYAIRITAVNDQGQLIAYPSEASRDFFLVPDREIESRYALRTLGAFVVHTGNTAACPTIPPCHQAIGTALPNVKVFSPEGLPPGLQQ